MEAGNCKRAKITGFEVSAIYCYPEDDETFEDYGMLISGVKFEHVANPRKWMGWEPDPHVITVNHIGYKPLSRKVALATVTLR